MHFRTALTLTLALTSAPQSLAKNTIINDYIPAAALAQDTCTPKCRVEFSHCMKAAAKAHTEKQRAFVCKIWTCAMWDTCPGCGFCVPEYNL